MKMGNRSESKLEALKNATNRYLSIPLPLFRLGKQEPPSPLCVCPSKQYAVRTYVREQAECARWMRREGVFLLPRGHESTAGQW